MTRSLFGVPFCHCCWQEGADCVLSVLREVFSHLLPPPYVCCCWVVAAFWHPEVQSCPTPSSFAALSLWPPQPRRRWLVSGRRTPNPAVLCPLTSPFTSKASCGSTNVGLGAAHPHFPRQDADSPPLHWSFLSRRPSQLCAICHSQTASAHSPLPPFSLCPDSWDN